MKHMKIFREVGIILVYNKKLKKKLENKGDMFYFMGCLLNLAGDVFRIYNPRTEIISITRNVKWLNKMAHEVEKKENWIEDESEYKYITTPEADKIDNEI